MRRIVTLLTLALSAWYVSNQQRRAQLQAKLQTAISSLLGTGGKEETPTFNEMATAARTRMDELRSQATATVSDLAGMAKRAGDVAAQQAPELAREAAQRAGNAAAGVQEAAGAVTDRAQQAAQAATGTGQEAASAPEAPGPVSTDVDAPAPSVHETVQAELADIDQTVQDLGTQAVPEPPEESAVRSADAATSGILGVEAPPTAQTFDIGAARGGDVAVESREPARTETPTTGMEQPPVVDRAAEVAERTSGDFVGNKATRVFHAATAGNLPAEDNRVYFDTEEEAIAAGFRPAENEGLESAGS